MSDRVKCFLLVGLLIASVGLLVYANMLSSNVPIH
jgi:hypothetical protein